jgi:hypothetical protein
MSLTTLVQSLKNQLNNVLPGQLADMLRAIGFGNVVRAFETYLYRQKPVATNPYVIATYQVITLPDDVKARVIGTAYAIAGGVTGPLTVATFASGTHPATGEISVGPTGDILVLAADALTSVDIAYAPQKLDVVELTLPVVAASGLCSLTALINATTPAGAALGAGVVVLMEAEVIAGGVTGKYFVDLPNDSNPGTSAHCSLKVAKDTVIFKVSDAVTSARLKFGVIPGIDLNALLEATGSYV